MNWLRHLMETYLNQIPENSLMKAKADAKKTTDAITILDRMAGDSPELRRLRQEARVNAAVAQLIYDARNKAGLSQAELAERIGTKQSVISRLEDADYEGHSLTMLQRIAAALGQCLEIRFRAPEKTVGGRAQMPQFCSLQHKCWFGSSRMPEDNSSPTKP